MSDSDSEGNGISSGLNLAISLCLTYTLCIVCVRLWIRKGTFGYDDLAVFTTTVFALGHTAADYVALANGLGKPWDTLIGTGRMNTLNNSSVAGIVLFGIALYMSKLCVLAFLHRITKNKKQIAGYYITAGLIAVLGLISILVVTANCHAGAGLYWAFEDNHRSCPAQLDRWRVFTAFDVITELVLLALPVQLVWHLQMPLRKKAMVLTAFYLRTPVIAFSLARNYYTLGLDSDSTDPGQDGALVVIWIEIELAYALAASTLSALKAFTESFNSGFGQGFTRGRDTQYATPNSKGSTGSSHEKTTSAAALDKEATERIEMQRQSPGPGRPSAVWNRADETTVLRPDSDCVNVTKVSAQPAGRIWKHGKGESHERSKDDLFIMRETELSIHHDETPMLGRL